MASDELLRKIDDTLERNTEAFERNTEAFERMVRTMDRVDTRLDRDAARDREMREFLDALTQRHVGITEAMIAAMTAGFERLEERISSSSAKLQAEIADQRAQIQANTDALLKVLDRLGPSPQQG